jgi:predicted small metal-binding protein
MKSTFVALLALASLSTFSGIAFAEDAPAAAKAEAGAPLKSVTCPDPCNFEVKSRDEKELIAIVKAHAKKFHKMSLNDEKVKGMIKTN